MGQNKNYAMKEKSRYRVSVKSRGSLTLPLSRARRCLLAALLIGSTCFILVYEYNSHRSFASPSLNKLARFQSCSISNILSTGLPFLSSASPIAFDEFVNRRQRLATALHVDGVDAYIVEPGYTFQYYANVSQKDWEVWEPEERPFLMVVQWEVRKDKSLMARTRFLAPSFEVERAKLLDMPFGEEERGDEGLDFVPWEEHWNPYSTLFNSWRWYGNGDEVFKEGRNPRIMVDEEMRDFIQRGLGEVGFEVVGLGGEVERVKQTKSKAEIEILRAVNTGTVEVVRATRKCMYPGLTENQVIEVLDNTLRAAGFNPFFDIVLFDENASNPHGGTNRSRVLEAETFVLIDVGAHLYGYSSDICRTFFPPFLVKPASEEEFQALPQIIQQKISVWNTVLEAQTQSIHSLHQGNSAASVDVAARKVITDAGYGDAFTHRVGHGIGIKAHESPYLNKGNINVTLKAGMAFTSEPGIYLVDKFGVRHEDVLLIKENGEPDILTGMRGMGPWDP